MDSSINVAPSSLAQAAYVQQKLEGCFCKTYQKLYPYKSTIHRLQEILLWRRAYLSLLLYLAVHGFFIYIAQNPDITAIRLLGTILLWGLICDAFLRAALRDREQRPAARHLRRPEIPPASLEKALEVAISPKASRELASFETICLRLAQAWMWLDNLRLAFCYWIINEPFTCAAVLFFPGIVLCIVGKLVPNIVVMYIAVMATLVYPYMEFCEFQTKVVTTVFERYPKLAQKLQAFKNTILSLGVQKEDSLELSLDVGGEARTQEMLTTEFQQAMIRGATQKPVDSHSSVPEMDLTRPTHTHEKETINAMEQSLGATPIGSVSRLDNSLSLPRFPPQTVRNLDEYDPLMDSFDLELTRLPRQADSIDSGHHFSPLGRVDEKDEQDDSFTETAEVPRGSVGIPNKKLHVSGHAGHHIRGAPLAYRRLAVKK